ncbi:hypothetical protein OG216_15710 [Streptomycetaceae bacterium NBC_01309]
MSNPQPGTESVRESDRTGRTAPRNRALDALRELDVELARLSRTARSDAELRAALHGLLVSLRATTAHADGTTTLVVGSEAWTRLQMAVGRRARVR